MNRTFMIESCTGKKLGQLTIPQRKFEEFQNESFYPLGVVSFMIPCYTFWYICKHYIGGKRGYYLQKTLPGYSHFRLIHK